MCTALCKKCYIDYYIEMFGEQPLILNFLCLDKKLKCISCMSETDEDYYMEDSYQDKVNKGIV